MSDSETPAVRAEIIAICQEHLVRLGEAVGQAAENRLASVASQAVADTSAALEQVVDLTRRIRAARDPAAVLVELAESAGQFCHQAVVLLKDHDRLTAFRVSGDSDPAKPLKRSGVSFALASAPALAQAVETRCVVVTRGRQHNVSQPLASSLGYTDETELHIFPVVLRGTVLGLLLSAGLGRRGAAIESLILTAEAWIEALNSRPQA